MLVTGTMDVKMDITDASAKHITQQYLRQIIGLGESGWVDTRSKPPQVIREMVDVGYHKTEYERQGIRPATPSDLVLWAAMEEIKNVHAIPGAKKS